MPHDNPAKQVRLRRRAVWQGCWLGLLLAVMAVWGAAGASPKRVLILDPFGRDVAPFSTAVAAFRTTLARELGEPVEFHEVPLDLARFAEPKGEGPLVAFLEGRIKSRPVDLVVPIGGAGAQFAVRHRDRLFPETPVLVVGSDPRFVPSGFLRTNATLVTQKVNPSSMVEDILQLQPQTTNIVVVFGASPLEKYWVGECRREFQSFTNRVGFTWLNDSPLERILKRCAVLPPRSFILHVLFVVDAAGVPCERSEALRRLHEVANAPLFGYFASEFGLGPIGGRLYQDTEVGAQGARAATRILRGERPESIPPQVLGAAAPVFDWRELRRWGIREARLPAGSVIQFRQPGFWEHYRWLIVGTVVFCLLQAALIVSLLINRAKRRQREAEATLLADISSRFVNLPPSEVEHEIMNAERRICEFLGLDLAALWQWSDEAPGLLMLTHFYRAEGGLQPPKQISANEFFPWSRQEMLVGRTLAVSSMEELPAEAARDRESYRQYGVKSTLVIPLAAGGEPPIGALGFNTTRAERDWPEALVRRLQLVAQIFTNALVRKRAEQALRGSEERFRLLIEQAPEAILVLDPEQNRLLEVNAEAEALFGCGRQELLSSGPQRFYTPEQPDGRPVADSMRANTERALRGETVLFERTISNALGQRLDCEVRLVRLPARGHKLVRASFINITERKQAEAEVLRQRAELAHVARVATMGELAASVAHELNQPLGAILANAEAAEMFLQQDPPALGELRDILADIRKDDERAGEVIRRMRGLLRRHELERQPLQLNLLVEDVLRLVSADAALRGMTIGAELSPHLPPVQGDRIHLQQVLLNLIMNAMEAMAKQPPEQRRLTVRTSQPGDGGAEISVADSGPGIAPGDQPHLFDPFFTTKPNGMGMGLAIARKIVEAHHGRIWAESKGAGGAIFRFTLPAGPEEMKS